MNEDEIIEAQIQEMGAYWERFKLFNLIYDSDIYA